MSEKETPRNRKQDSGSTDAGQAQVQAAVDEATEKGYFGTVPDPTPNENYTFAGAAKGAPTPETDADLAREVGSLRFGRK